jgi:uncharacterized protein
MDQARQSYLEELAECGIEIEELALPEEREIIERELHKNLVIYTEAARGLRDRKPITNSGKIGVNQPCPCGSGKKFKKCCM